MQTVTPTMDLPDDLVQRLRQARRIAVLTGAGVSAESGVPTFRDAQTGLWARQDPMTLASPEGFARDPALVWRWYRHRRDLVNQARFNAGHQALAELQGLVESLTLITQNVDGYHQQAGAREVMELHGNIQRTICSVTRRLIDDEWLERHAGREPPPSPHHSEGLARPDVVWFGERLDEQILTKAFSAAADCELMIVAGTAGVVHPAASIPQLAIEQGAVLIDINPAVSELTPLANWHLAGPGAHWLPKLAEARAWDARSHR